VQFNSHVRKQDTYNLNIINQIELNPNIINQIELNSQINENNPKYKNMRSKSKIAVKKKTHQ
jgi:hypothetical protein